MRSPDYFHQRVIVDPVSGCWHWQLRLNSAGYGEVGGGNRRGTRQAHRASYETFVGPIPPGLWLDHLCRTRDCVNPAHLEAVTIRENLLRGTGFPAARAAQTHCVHGHEFNERNTWTRPNGTRQCRRCAALRERRRRQAKKDAET